MSAPTPDESGPGPRWPAEPALVLCRALLRAASRLVPRARRADRLEEWEAELWELRRRVARVPGRYPPAAVATARYTAGALRHALWELGASLSADALRQDLRHATRTLARAHGFTAVAVLTLAVGVGATATIFTAVDALLLRAPAGVADPARAVQVGRGRGPGDFDTFSYPNYLTLRAETRALAGLAAFASRGVAIGTGGASEPGTALAATHDYFAVLGVRPTLGRAFVPDDERGEPVAVIGDALWRRRFGGAPDVLGRTLVVNGRTLRVVGVAPPGFVGSELAESGIDVWVPLSAADAVVSGVASRGLLERRELNWLTLVGRLAPGATLDAARAEMRALTARLRSLDPTFADQRVNVTAGVGLRPDERRDAGRVLALMLAGAALVLAVACANLGGLLLARGLARRREIGVRAALGASRARVVRQLLAECLLLALLGGLAATALARWGARALAAVVPYDMSVELEPDVRVLAFALAVAATTTLLFGLAPAWRAARVDVVTVLAGGGARGVAGGRSRARGVLVAAQLALAFVLLAGATLLARSVRNALRADPGFETARLLVLPLDLARRGDARGDARGDVRRAAAFYDALLARVRALPGMEAAALAQRAPIGEGRATRVVRPADADDDWYAPPVEFNVVSADYFRATGVRVPRGRAIEAGDAAAGAPPVVVLNEALARRFWPGEDPLGREVAYHADGGRVVARVVGVAADTRSRSLGEPPAPLVYLPYGPRLAPAAMRLHVRTHGDPAAAAPAVLDAVRALDPDLPAFGASTGRDLVGRSVRETRLVGAIAGAFGALALGMALLGLYGVVTYAAALRTRELGIRLALGARGTDVLRAVLGEGLALAAVGTAAGACAAAALLRALERLLHGVVPTDAATFGATAALLALASLGASAVPAWRTLRADPLRALRGD